MKKLIGLIVITIVTYAIISLAVHTIEHGRCADAHPMGKTTYELVK